MTGETWKGRANFGFVRIPVTLRPAARCRTGRPVTELPKRSLYGGGAGHVSATKPRRGAS